MRGRTPAPPPSSPTTASPLTTTTPSPSSLRTSLAVSKESSLPSTEKWLGLGDTYFASLCSNLINERYRRFLKKSTSSPWKSTAQCCSVSHSSSLVARIRHTKISTSLCGLRFPDWCRRCLLGTVSTIMPPTGMESFPQSILLLLLNCILFPSDDSLRQEYPFTLKLVQKDGSWCSRCEWHRFCRGCPLPCSNSGFAFASSYLAIDWDQTALHLRYLPTQERVRFTVWFRLYFTFVLSHGIFLSFTGVQSRSKRVKLSQSCVRTNHPRQVP